MRQDLPNDWQAWPCPELTQEIGAFWFEEQASVLLEVPCAVAPFHCNYLVTPQHPDFAERTINGPADFDVDPRLAA